MDKFEKRFQTFCYSIVLLYKCLYILLHYIALHAKRILHTYIWRIWRANKKIPSYAFWENGCDAMRYVQIGIATDDSGNIGLCDKASDARRQHDKRVKSKNGSGVREKDKAKNIHRYWNIKYNVYRVCNTRLGDATRCYHRFYTIFFYSALALVFDEYVLLLAACTPSSYRIECRDIWNGAVSSLARAIKY